MAEVIIVGGGVAGLGAGLLLARDGHHVRLLERDPGPPPAEAGEAWREWERRGVNQFRMLHYFLPRFREIAEAELPDVVAEMEAAGALRTNPLDGLPAELRDGGRPGDERMTLVTGRRPVVEAAIARVASAQDGLDVERGVAVRGLLVDDARANGTPHVRGVVTEAGEELRADLVVDACGRRSALPEWLATAGASPGVEEKDDCGFIYYGRHFRSADGSLPVAFGAPLQHYDSVSYLMLPADNGTWGVGLVTSAADATLRAARNVDVWERVTKSYPLVAHWMDGEPISDGVAVMAKIEDRHRRYWAGDVPSATGVVALGDSWACTNPSVGRGASIGLLHAVCLRDVLREVPTNEPLELARRWDETTTAVVEPLYRDTLAFDRHRLAEIDAQIEGRTYETDDVSWQFGKALGSAASRDPDLVRAALLIGGLLERGVDVFAEPRIAERTLELATDDPPPGPDRNELLSIVGAGD
jgi:2-polyprenyl-6-methoxyphenol hydroxylase-like FAD-dependent oxidoreductase